jgi:hypothetical protein
MGYKYCKLQAATCFLPQALARAAPGQALGGALNRFLARLAHLGGAHAAAAWKAWRQRCAALGLLPAQPAARPAWRQRCAALGLLPVQAAAQRVGRKRRAAQDACVMRKSGWCSACGTVHTCPQ